MVPLPQMILHFLFSLGFMAAFVSLSMDSSYIISSSHASVILKSQLFIQACLIFTTHFIICRNSLCNFSLKAHKQRSSNHPL